MTDLSILDLSLAKMQASTIDPADVAALLEAENAGKTRKGVIAYLEGLLPPDGPENEPDGEMLTNGDFSSAEGWTLGSDGDPNEVENILPGTDLTLDQGRSILFGEKAVVSPELAEFLRGRGQVR